VQLPVRVFVTASESAELPRRQSDWPLAALGQILPVASAVGLPQSAPHRQEPQERGRWAIPPQKKHLRWLCFESISPNPKSSKDSPNLLTNSRNLFFPAQFDPRLPSIGLRMRCLGTRNFRQSVSKRMQPALTYSIAGTHPAWTDLPCPNSEKKIERRKLLHQPADQSN
jgi:hypothetical protein